MTCNGKGVRALVLLCVFVLVSVLAAAAAPESRNDRDAPFLHPGPEHLLGTDELGRDIFELLLEGAGTSLLLSFSAAFLATLLGTCSGIAAGMFGGRTDHLLMGLCDVFFLIPALPLLIIIASCFRPGLWNIILSIALLGWAGTARVVRSRVLQIRGAPFILVSRSMGASHVHVMFGHILPHMLEIVLARASLAVSGAMLAEAGLSFLGLGEPTRTTWGAILAKAFTHGAVVNGEVWWYLPPILCIGSTVLLFTLFSLGPGESPEPLHLQAPSVLPSRAKERKGSPSFHGPNGAGGEMVLAVQDLSVAFRGPGGAVSMALVGIDLQVDEGDRVAVVGETGGGKSILLLALMGLLPGNATVMGAVWYRGLDLLYSLRLECCVRASIPQHERSFVSRSP